MTQQIDLGLLRFAFLGDYVPGTTYELNNVVRYGGNSYVYVSTIKTSGNDPLNTAYWQKILEGFKFRGVYSSGTSYIPGDIVTLGATSFLALQASANIATTDTSVWSQINSGLMPRGQWVTATSYNINDIVIRGGNTYIAVAAHISATFASDLTANKWSLFNGGIKWKGSWTTAKAYAINDIVTDSGSTYIVEADHTSGASVSADLIERNISLLASGVDNPWIYSEVNLNASADVTIQTHYLVNTGTNQVIATLPSAPPNGALVKFTDIFDCRKNPLVIKAGDSLTKIGGDLSPFLLDTQYTSLLLSFNTTTKNWVIV